MNDNYLRQCAKCGAEKPIWDFPVQYKMKSGRDVRCYSCVTEHNAKFRSKLKW